MTRVLAYTSPARGHLYPLVPVLDELHDRGHEIAVRTLPSEVEMLRARGFDAEPLSADILAIEPDDWRARTPTGAMKRGLAMFARRARHELADFGRAIRATAPEVLLVDVSTWGAAAVAEADGRPWAQWLPHPSPLPSPEVPPFGSGLRPASGPLGRLRDRVVHEMTMPSFERALLPGVKARPAAGRARAPGRRPGGPHSRPAHALPLGRAVGVPALGLARVLAAHRAGDMGPAGRGAGMARRDRPAARARQHVVRVPGRRTPGRLRARRASR